MHLYDDQISLISTQAKLLQNLLETFKINYSSDKDKNDKYQELIDRESIKLASELNKYRNPQSSLLFLQTSFGLLFETAKNKRLSRNTQNIGSGTSKFFDKYHDGYFVTRLKILIAAYLKLYVDKADLSKLKDLFITSISGNTKELRDDFSLIFDEYIKEHREVTEKQKIISLKEQAQDSFKDHYKDLSAFLNSDTSPTRDPLDSLKQILFYDDKLQNPQSTKEKEDFELEAHELLCSYLGYVTSEAGEITILDPKTKELLPFIDEHRRAFENLSLPVKKKLKLFFHRTIIRFSYHLIQKHMKIDLAKQLQAENIFKSLAIDSEDQLLENIKSLLFSAYKYQNPQSTKEKKDFELEAHELLRSYLVYVTSEDDKISTLDQKTRKLLPFIDEHRRAFIEMDASQKKQLFDYTQRQFDFLIFKFHQKEILIDFEFAITRSPYQRKESDKLLSFKRLLFYHDRLQNPQFTKEEGDIKLEAHELLCSYLGYVTGKARETPNSDQKTRELLPFIDEHREAFSTLDESTKQQLTSFHFLANQNLLAKLLDLKNSQSQQLSIAEIFDKAQQLLKELLTLDNLINPPVKTDTYKSKPDFEKTAKDLLMTYLEALLSNDRSIIDSHQYSNFFEKLDLDKTKLDPHKIEEITVYFLDKKQYKLSEICDGFLDRPDPQRMLRIRVLRKKITDYRLKLNENSNDMQAKAFEYITLYSLYEAMGNIPSDLLLKARTFFSALRKNFKFYIDKTRYTEDMKKLFLKQFLKLRANYTRIEPEKLTTIPENEHLPKWRALTKSVIEVSNMNLGR